MPTVDFGFNDEIEFGEDATNSRRVKAFGEKEYTHTPLKCRNAITSGSGGLIRRRLSKGKKSSGKGRRV